MALVTAEHPLEVFFANLRSYAPLSDDDRAALAAIPSRIRRLDAGSHLVRDGAIPRNCAVILSGYAFRSKTTGDGSRQILAVCIPGDAIDLQNIFLEVADHSVQLLTNAMVAELPRDHLQELVLTRPGIARAIMHLNLVEAAILREWVVNVGRRDARERISHILCEFAVRLEARGLTFQGGFELPMTQEQLADATGLTSVHVNRTLKSLEADGLIARRRRHIYFTDWRALQDAGDFTRGYLHLETAEAGIEPHLVST